MIRHGSSWRTSFGSVNSRGQAACFAAWPYFLSDFQCQARVLASSELSDFDSSRAFADDPEVDERTRDIAELFRQIFWPFDQDDGGGDVQMIGEVKRRRGIRTDTEGIDMNRAIHLLVFERIDFLEHKGGARDRPLHAKRAQESLDKSRFA